MTEEEYLIVSNRQWLRIAIHALRELMAEPRYGIKDPERIYEVKAMLQIANDELSDFVRILR